MDYKIPTGSINKSSPRLEHGDCHDQLAREEGMHLIEALLVEIMKPIEKPAKTAEGNGT